jgi:predicted nuclease with TOPRIM domain
MTSKAKADVAESMDEIEELRAELKEMVDELKDEMAEIEERWSEVANQIVESTVTAYKKDIREDLFGLAWVPYWRVKIDSKEQELPAYQVN